MTHILVILHAVYHGLCGEDEMGDKRKDIPAMMHISHGIEANLACGDTVIVIQDDEIKGRIYTIDKVIKITEEVDGLHYRTNKLEIRAASEKDLYYNEFLR